MYQERDYLRAIELIRQGKIMLKQLIFNYFTFQDYRNAYEYIEERKDQVMKVTIKRL